PIENKNKPIDDSKRIKLKIIGIVITLIINCTGLFLSRSYLGTMIILTTFLIALLMIAAKIKERGSD
ncbi:accessory gene regulator B family protein, partial [Ruminococcus sp.]